MRLMIKRFAGLFGVFRIPFLFAVAHDEDQADGGEQKRADQQQDADQQTAEGNVFRIGLESCRIESAHRDDDDNDA